MSNQIAIFTGGSCRGNPGPGGFAAIIQRGCEEKVISGGECHTTNNRMEVTAVIVGLEALDGSQEVKVVTDSQYVTTLLKGGRTRANRDLVQQLRPLSSRHKVSAESIPAHGGYTLGLQRAQTSTRSVESPAHSVQAMNERCHGLAKAEAERQSQSNDCGCQIANFKNYGSIQVLNQAFGDHWLYIGRKNSYAGLEQSPLANPHKVSDFGGKRGATLPHYRRWLWQRIQTGDEAVLKALRAINEQTVLICWCHPHPCHGDVVKAAARWLRVQET